MILSRESGEGDEAVSGVIGRWRNGKGRQWRRRRGGSGRSHLTDLSDDISAGYLRSRSRAEIARLQDILPIQSPDQAFQ